MNFIYKKYSLHRLIFLQKTKCCQPQNTTCDAVSGLRTRHTRYRKFFGIIAFLFSIANLFGQAPTWNNSYISAKINEYLAKDFYDKTYREYGDSTALPKLQVILCDDSNLVNENSAMKYKVGVERKKLIFVGNNCLPTDSSYSFRWAKIDKKDFANKIIWKLDSIYSSDKLIIVKNGIDTMRMNISINSIYRQVYFNSLEYYIVLRTPLTIKFTKGDFDINKIYPKILFPLLPSSEAEKLKNEYSGADQFISNGEWLYEMRNSSDSIHCAFTTKDSYTLKDTIGVTVTGTIKLTGDCGAEPTWGLMYNQKGEWKTIEEPMEVQMCCGLPFWNCRNATFIIYNFQYLYEQKKLLPGEYKIILVGENQKNFLTNSFWVVK
jgi:hypothetical protein